MVACAAACSTLTALSLLLCVAVAALWVRSYAMADYVMWRTPDGWRGAWTSRGRLVVGWTLAEWREDEPQWGVLYERGEPVPVEQELRWARQSVGVLTVMEGPPQPVIVRWEKAGIVWWRWHGRQDGGGPASVVRLFVPWWLVAAALAVLPAAGLLRHRRRVRRRRLNLCPRCGYDLRATPERCPECGGGRRLGRRTMTCAA
jgi:hypothetical protein